MACPRVLHTALVEGRPEYMLRVLPGRGDDGRGRVDTWDRQNVIEVTPGEAYDAEVDAVVLQRPQELELSQRLGGRPPGIDLPALYLEHNPPPGPFSDVRHPVADRPELTLASIRRYRHDGERD